MGEEHDSSMRSLELAVGKAQALAMGEEVRQLATELRGSRSVLLSSEAQAEKARETTEQLEMQLLTSTDEQKQLREHRRQMELESQAEIEALNSAARKESDEETVIQRRFVELQEELCE